MDLSSKRSILTGGASIPRNPLIAETLFRSEDIEKWGSGLRRISDECRKAGVKVKFIRNKSGFTVAFFRPASTPRKGLVENQKKILDLVTAAPHISKRELSAAVGISTTAIDKNIAVLKNKGLLRRIGPDKGGHWEVVE